MIPIDFKSALVELLENNSRILFLGIGENRMNDDGFGQYISFYLKQRLKSTSTLKKVKVINGKTDYIERKKEILEFNPDLLLIVDTCQPNNTLEIKPGSLLLRYESDFVNWLPLSSHVLPIPVFITELRYSIPELKTALIGLVPISTEYAKDVKQYKPDVYSLDDYELDPDIPFYEFSLTPKIQKIADLLVEYLQKILEI